MIGGDGSSIDDAGNVCWRSNWHNVGHGARGHIVNQWRSLSKRVTGLLRSDRHQAGKHRTSEAGAADIPGRCDTVTRQNDFNTRPLIGEPGYIRDQPPIPRNRTLAWRFCKVMTGPAARTATKSAED